MSKSLCWRLFRGSGRSHVNWCVSVDYHTITFPIRPAHSGCHSRSVGSPRHMPGLRLLIEFKTDKVNLESSQLDACILQFKELGLLGFAENRSRGRKDVSRRHAHRSGRAIPYPIERHIEGPGESAGSCQAGVFQGIAEWWRQAVAK